MTTERDIQNQIAFAEQKGLERGFEQGIESTAKKMLADNVPAEVIAKYTGLSAEEIKKL